VKFNHAAIVFDAMVVPLPVAFYKLIKVKMFWLHVLFSLSSNILNDARFKLYVCTFSLYFVHLLRLHRTQ